MQFTYDSYRKLLHLLNANGYKTCSYHDYSDYDKCAILRHDIDNDIGKSLQLAEIEQEEGVKSTYFVLLTSNFYNVFSLENIRKLQKMGEYGHDIGLHFDEARYPELSGNAEAIVEKIKKEAEILSEAVGREVASVSMHRPSKTVLESDIHIQGMVNSYSKEFFEHFKYVSDSRRRWREPAEDIIKSQEFGRLHILTHAFWYYEEEMDIHATVRNYINGANARYYGWMKENIKDIDSIVSKEEIR